MILTDPPLSNPFQETDMARDKLDMLYNQVQEQQATIRMLSDCVGLLMRIQNIKDDRARAKKSAAPIISSGGQG